MPDIICSKCSVTMEYKDGVYTCPECALRLKSATTPKQESQRTIFPNLARPLSAEELIEFKQWARDNYIPGTDIKSIWHPAIRAECELMNLEQIQGS